MKQHDANNPLSISIYIVSCHWVINGDPGYSKTLYTCFSDAQKCFFQDLSEERKDGNIAEWQNSPKFVEEKTSQSYECYLDNEYCENHYSISIEEVSLLLSSEFINTISRMAKPKPALIDIPTLAARDQLLESLWTSLEDIPMNPKTECIEVPILSFPAGTNREDVWHWFDERHSKGISYLLYRHNTFLEKNAETCRFLLNRICPECTSELCCYNPTGRCLIPVAYSRSPRLHNDGCEDFCPEK